MSVKYQRKNRLNTSIRDQQLTLQSTQHFQLINSVANTLEFHKKLIEVFNFHLVCICVKNENKLRKNTQTRQRQYSPEKKYENQQYYFEIQGTNLYITKAQVKHTFSLQKYLNQNSQYLRFEIPEEQIFIIQSCSASNQNNLKINSKIMLISDEGMMNNNYVNCSIIKPLDLIQENIRLRALKLNKSTTKNFTVMSQSVKKLNINWNRQQVKSPGLTQKSVCSDWRPQRQMRKNSMNIIPNCDIRGVQSKKSIQKIQRPKSRSLSKSQKNLTIKNVGPINLFQKSKQKPQLISKSTKFLNTSLAESRQNSQIKNIRYNNKVSISSITDQISSQSYYTAKKDINKDFQIPDKVQSKKSIQTASKENRLNGNPSLNSSVNAKLTYTQYKNNRLNCMNFNSSTNLDPKKFTKNISQAKIAQVSRTLLINKKKKQSQ